MATLLSAAETAKPDRVIALRDLPLLFVDDGGIGSSAGVVRTPHAAQTRSEPVIVADRPWEQRVYVYGSVYFDPAAGQLRLWYLGYKPVEKSDDKALVPGFPKGNLNLVLYATSQDGVRWIKPSLGLHTFDGSPENNILFSMHSPSVLKDDREKDPAKRYKMLGSMSGNYHAAYSADGLRWTAYPKNPVLKSADTITLAQDPQTGEYLAFHKVLAMVRGCKRRVVWLSTSRDFQTWSEPELVFAPDVEDDAWATQPGQRTEVYSMSVFPHAAGFVGMPMIFRLMRERLKEECAPSQSRHDGPIDVQLATSTDARTWKRSWPRINMIPRGAPGSFDYGAILGVSSTAVDMADETWVYYTALTTGHGAPIPPKQISIGRASWRRHGYVSLDAGPDGGRIETLPLKLASPTLLVNADAGRGKLRVALLESDGRPIAGYGLDDCEPLRADATRWPVQWKSANSAPTDRPVRVVIEMSDARLFSLSPPQGG
jgi:hypothetical protein